ncbi:MAG TPA: hypothetical protein VFK30_14935, partial [Anaerolineae bacterium]|nr:hypothetical protein [Anaerolineae bacterium]
MNLQDLIQIHDQQQRIDITFNDTRREVTPYVVRHFSLEDKYGFILYSRLNVENADRVIQEQIDYFADLDVDFEWKWFKHDTPIDLHDRLIAHGFEPEEPEALMALDIEHAPSILLQSITLGVRRITDPNEVPSLIKVLEGVWGEPYE